MIFHNLKYHTDSLVWALYIEFYANIQAVSYSFGALNTIPNTATTTRQNLNILSKHVDSARPR
jgi:hypothetical protein